jgi:hypothetical protein
MVEVVRACMVGSTHFGSGGSCYIRCRKTNDILEKIYINEFVDVSKFVASMLYNKAMGKIHYYKKAL